MPQPPVVPRPSFLTLTTLLLPAVLLLLTACRPQDRGERSSVPVPAANSRPADSTSGQSAPAAPPSNAPNSADALFRDVTAETGIGMTYRNGEEADQYSILESLGGGVGLIDYDRDGFWDVFLTGGGYFEQGEVRGHPHRLYRNLGGWKFRDVTSETGLDQPRFYSHGCAVGDYDRDGWPDLLVTGYGRLALYRNLEGGGFQEVAQQAGLLDTKTDLHWSTGAAWGDLNGDGHPDLFVTHYLDWRPDNHQPCRGYGPDVPHDVCPPNDYEPLGQQLFLNRGDGTFQDASGRLEPNRGKGLGVLLLDADGDAKLDIYVTNDTLPNQLYRNQGDGNWREVARFCGVATSELGRPEGSMGVDAADLDGSGRPSLFVTNFERQMHALYLNRGDGLFEHYTHRTGISALGTNRVGWASVFLDVDLDGDEDLVISNGHVLRHPRPPQTVAQRTELLRNEPAASQSGSLARFQDATQEGGSYFRGAHRGRGIAVGDLDQDGRPDLVVSHVNEPIAVLRGQGGRGCHWLGIELRPRRHQSPVGSRLELQTTSGKQVRYVKGGGSYLSTGDQRVRFGLGYNDTILGLTVRWPDGKLQRWDAAQLPLDQYHVLEQSDGNE